MRISSPDCPSETASGGKAGGATPGLVGTAENLARTSVSSASSECLPGTTKGRRSGRWQQKPQLTRASERSALWRRVLDRKIGRCGAAYADAHLLTTARRITPAE